MPRVMKQNTENGMRKKGCTEEGNGGSGEVSRVSRDRRESNVEVEVKQWEVKNTVVDEGRIRGGGRSRNYITKSVMQEIEQ